MKSQDASPNGASLTNDDQGIIDASVSDGRSYACPLNSALPKQRLEQGGSGVCSAVDRGFLLCRVLASRQPAFVGPAGLPDRPFFFLDSLDETNEQRSFTSHGTGCVPCIANCRIGFSCVTCRWNAKFPDGAALWPEGLACSNDRASRQSRTRPRSLCVRNRPGPEVVQRTGARRRYPCRRHAHPGT